MKTKEFDINGKKITMRAPLVRDLKAVGHFSNNAVEQEIALIANLTGLHKDEIEELEYKVYAPLQKELKGFLE